MTTTLQITDPKESSTLTAFMKVPPTENVTQSQNLVTIQTKNSEVSNITIVMVVVISLLVGTIILLLLAFFFYKRKFAANEA
jgi:hypothetical protein